MNCSSARSSRASAPFSTTNRAPDIFAAASKSMRPSASPISKCSLGLKPSGNVGALPCWRSSTLSFSSLPSGVSSSGRLGIAAKLRFERPRRLPLRRLQLRHRRLEPGDLGAIVVGRDNILARHRHADLLRNGVAPLLRGLERQDRRPALFVQRNQLFRAWAQPAATQALVKSFRVLADRSDIVHDLASKRRLATAPSR